MKTYFVNFLKIKKIFIAGLSFVLVALFLTAALLKPDGILPAQSKPYPVYKVKTGKKVAALTFNVSWGGKVAGPVLDALQKQDVKATFFVSGAWAKKYPELAHRIGEEGHEIASNGNRQINLSAETKATVQDELKKSRELIQEATGHPPSLLRVPYGDWNDTVLAEAAGLGYTVVQWSVDSLDIQTPGKNAVVNNVVNKVHPGAIILMHASDTASQTPEAIPAIIEGLKNGGYELVTVSNLLKKGPGVID
ncbi:MAG: polysaccharide deacetylase family protein [Firmicutes bacterium]|nr:polysaccharide deacetylase family protein [Bacillota bacterium]